MSPRLSHGCTWVLLLAMLLAMAAGMMAWGPVLLRTDAAVRPAHAWASLPLVVVAAWGVWKVRHERWPRALRAPWLAFFALAWAAAAAGLLYHLTLSVSAQAASHAFGAAAMTMLALAFAAERMDAWFGSRAALVAAAAVAGGAALWWFAGHWGGGQGDLRALLLLQCLPLLLIPAGALSLPGLFTRAADWVVMLCIYLIARSVELFDAPLDTLTGLGGHALMHLLLAGGVAWPLYRTGAASPSEPTQRRTSLNTSS